VYSGCFVALVKVEMGLRSLNFCSSINISCWKVCMKSDSQQFIFIPLLLVFNISMVSSAFPYPCLLLKICTEYAKIGLFVFI